MTNVLILSGAGRHADPWHEYPATSAALAELLAGPGRDVEVSEDIDARLADLSDVSLLVVNAGAADDAPAPAAEVGAAREGLRSHVERGGAILGVHAAAFALPQVPEWAAALGGRWIHGRSMHPEISRTELHVVDSDHPITSGMTSIETFDERYSHLETLSGNRVLVDHEHDGIRHPLVWVRDSGAHRAAYSALGHDVRGYESAAVRELLVRTGDWLLEPRPEWGAR